MTTLPCYPYDIVKLIVGLDEDRCRIDFRSQLCAKFNVQGSVFWMVEDMKRGIKSHLASALNAPVDMQEEP